MRLLQKEPAITFQLQIRAIHGVTASVIRVRVNSDLSICTAYLSVFPLEKAGEIIRSITANGKTTRYDSGTRIRNWLRIVPELRFFTDDSLDYIEHIGEPLEK